MRNNGKTFIGFVVVAGVAAVMLTNAARADAMVENVDIDIVETDAADTMDNVAADAIENYQLDGSLFQQITDLEQEKVLMQLEKERAQLDLELDRLAAEKIKLHMEIDTLSGRAQQQQQELENEKARLEAEAERIAREKENLEAAAANPAKSAARTGNSKSNQDDADTIASEKYRLINVIGAGNQLQATVEDLSTGQNKRVTVGKTLGEFTVKSISLDDGVVLIKDGVTQNLNISNGN